jgi:putative transposase
MTQMLVKQNKFPVWQVCEFLELPRSSYYYESKKQDENELIQDVKEITGKYVRYGTRRVTEELKRSPYDYCVNRKHIQRIMRQEGLLRPQKVRKTRTTNSNHPYPRYLNLVNGLETTYPDQVWVSDITYVRLAKNFVYLAIVMDVFTRMIRGWYLDISMGQELTIKALQMALADHVPGIHHSDQGVQYAAHAYVDLLKSHGVKISMANPGKPEENGYAERFMRTIKEEEIDLSEYYDFSDTKNQIGHFIEDVYMTKRIHSSLGYLTPVEFESQWRDTQLVMDTP